MILSQLENKQQFKPMKHSEALKPLEEIEIGGGRRGGQ